MVSFSSLIPKKASPRKGRVGPIIVTSYWKRRFARWMHNAGSTSTNYRDDKLARPMFVFKAVVLVLTSSCADLFCLPKSICVQLQKLPNAEKLQFFTRGSSFSSELTK